MKKVTLSRTQLYDMVWQEPLNEISKRFYITYSELRKIYIDLKIPLPRGGYWSKLHWGKPTIKQPLSEDYSGKKDVDLYEIEPGYAANESYILGKSVKILESQFRVPIRLINPDPLIIKAKEYFEVHRQFWGSNFRFLQGTEILSIDVQISNLPRALRIFDTVIKVLRKRGHDISFNWDGTVAVIYGEYIAMRLREVNRVSDKPKGTYHSRELEPTGKFTFMIGRYHEIFVTDGQKLLENKIDTIIYKLEAEAKKWHDWHVEVEISRKEQEDKERIKREALARKTKELSDFKSLYLLADRMHQASIMRSYISLLEQHVLQSGIVTPEFKKWAEWARKKVDWYDPLLNRPDPLLDDNDKVEIYSAFHKK